MEDMTKGNLVLELAVKFSLSVVDLYKKGHKVKEFILSKQLLRSGTSVGANIVEANSGSSKKDFLNKINISLKEANESKYRIFLLSKAQFFEYDYDDLFKQVDSLISLLTKIVLTTKRSIGKSVKN